MRSDSGSVPTGAFLWRQLLRHWHSALRKPGDTFNPLLFYLMVVTLFPLGLGPDPNVLAMLAPGLLWVVALLATLTVAGKLFASDYADGSLEQLLLAPHPLYLSAMAEIVVHWLMAGLTLALASPLFAVMLKLPSDAIATLAISLLLGTWSLSLIAGIGAALTVGLRRGGALLSLIILPFMVPVLIFGASAVREAAQGYDPASWLALLGAYASAASILAPVAIATGLRISVDN